jgi:hypothetical protein
VALKAQQPSINPVPFNEEHGYCTQQGAYICAVLPAQVANVKLDELELASLRGDIEEAGLALDFDARSGTGSIAVAGPRFSGLQVPNRSPWSTLPKARWQPRSPLKC